MARRAACADQVVAAAHQITQALLLRRGRLHERQLAGAIQAHELLGVAPVGLDAITGTHGHQRRRDHVARHTQASEQPQQVKAARPGLVADGKTVGPAEAIDEAADRPLGVLDALHLRAATDRRQRRGDDRVLVHVQGDPQAHLLRGGRANVRHGLVLRRMRLWPKRPSTPQQSTRDRCDARGPALDRVHAD